MTIEPPSFLKRFLAFISRNRLRIAVYSVLFLVVAATGGAFAYHRWQTDKENQAFAAQAVQDALFATILQNYQDFLASLETYKGKGVDVTEAQAAKESLYALIQSGDYTAAQAQLDSLNANLAASLASKQAADQATADAAAKAEAEKATLSGKVTSSSQPIEGAAVAVSGNGTDTTATTDKDGVYTFKLAAGEYSLTTSKSGYVTDKKTVTLAVSQQVTTDIALTKSPAATPRPTAKPTATSSTTQSNGFSSYERTTVSTSRGTYTIDLIKVELGAGKGKVITDTGNTSDCANACGASSLATYVQNNGGFAGINGTYFCPPDYADCSGKTYSYLWKVWNSRASVMINQNNGSFEDQAFIGFGTDGTARYFSSWNSYKSSGFSLSAGINSGPHLVQGGSIILQDSEMDDKQRTAKGNRGSLGLKGQTVYAVVAKSASVPDLAAIMQTLGVDNAINLDGGGSSALYYLGSYKVGPGRALPNAIVFGQR